MTYLSPHEVQVAATEPMDGARPALPARAVSSRLRRLTAWIAAVFMRGDQLGLFMVAGVGMIALAPRHVLRAYAAVSRLMGNPVVLDPAAWPYVPITLPLGVILALITFRLERRARLIGLAISLLLAFAWIYRPVDPDFVLFVAAFYGIAFLLIQLPLPRISVALLATAYSVLALFAVMRWWQGTPAVGFIGGLPVLVPMLWYSVYEHRSNKPLRLRQFVAYIAGRLFFTPVLTYGELFGQVRGPELTATRWAGVRTLYIALLASIIGRIATLISELPTYDGIDGVSLLALSYVDYIRHCCNIVVRFNTFIGVMRLFGVPLRSNFRFWVLARTPNEHWQRWNILAREWFLTFVFYPIMRARRGLFAAVMAAFVAAGVLHMVPAAIIRGYSWSQVFGHSVYWIANGAAIYFVIKIPVLYPGFVDRLGMRDSRAWSVAGIVVTSAFYAVLHGLRTQAQTWSQMSDYVTRLLGGFSA